MKRLLNFINSHRFTVLAAELYLALCLLLYIMEFVMIYLLMLQAARMYIPESQCGIITLTDKSANIRRFFTFQPLSTVSIFCCVSAMTLLSSSACLYI